MRAARQLAATRGVPVNAALPAPVLDDVAPVDDDARGPARTARAHRAAERPGLHRVRRLARTLADLDEGGEVVGVPHVTEALFLRGSRALVLGEEVR